MKTIETERLILRGWSIDDTDDLFEYARNPDVGPNAGWEPHASKDVSMKIIESFIEKDEVWAICYKENNKVIGSLGLHNDRFRDIENVKMLGYVLSEEYWGKGIVAEAARSVIKYAFEELNLDLLSVYHYSFNLHSKRVIEKCGFKYEGTIRQSSKIFNGNVYDSVCYSILKDEYFSHK